MLGLSTEIIYLQLGSPDMTIVQGIDSRATQQCGMPPMFLQFAGWDLPGQNMEVTG